jgi:hypothetical protein
MKHALLFIALLCMLSVSLAAENRSLQEGTIVRMRMADCEGLHHSFMATMSGGQMPPAESCAEYVLVTDKVVYVIVGKSSDQLVPLAETTRFHFQNSEVVIRVDDARRESHFHVKAMVLRPEWERSQQLEEAEAVALMAAHRLQGAALTGTQR